MTKLTRFWLAAPWLAMSVPLAAAQWPQYRGPGADGVDDSQALPVTWNVESGQNIRWQTPLPGLAHASPIVWGDRVYVATSVKQTGEGELNPDIS